VRNRQYFNGREVILANLRFGHRTKAQGKVHARFHGRRGHTLPIGRHGNRQIGQNLTRFRDNMNNPRPGGARANKDWYGLTKSERRNKPLKFDMTLPGTDLVFRAGQCERKMVEHEQEFGVNATLNEQGKNISKVTPENLIQSALAGKEYRGTSRKNRSDGFDAIHFYDSKTLKNIIFNADTKNFVSAWVLSEIQSNYLKETGNIE
jgi:hypothetical protein